MPPDPADDPAARFHKETEPAAPPQKEEAPPLPPAGLVQMFEDTLTVPFAMGTVFSRHAKSSSPSFAVLAANIAVFAAALSGLVALRFWLTFPQGAGFRSLPLAVTTLFLLAAAGSFLAAGVVQFLASTAGGQADYLRSYQILSLLALFLPASAAASAFPFGWPALAALWAYLTAVAIEDLAGAPAARARAVVGGAALAAMAGGWIAAVQARNFLLPRMEQARLAAQMTRQAQDMLQALASAQPMPQAVIASTAPLDAPAQARQLLQAMQQTSSLNLVSGPSGNTMTPEQARAVAQEAQKQAAAAPQFAAQTLDTVMPMLDNPNLTKGMPAEQVKQIQQATALMKQMQDDLRAGRKVNPQTLAQLQALQMSAMRYMMQETQKKPKAQAQPQPGAKP